MPAVIVENDESQWKDETGTRYHFPKRYLSLLLPGQKVVYYRGRLRTPAFAANRLSADRHYFGIAKIGCVYADPNSSKGDHFAPGRIQMANGIGAMPEHKKPLTHYAGQFHLCVSAEHRWILQLFHCRILTAYNSAQTLSQCPKVYQLNRQLCPFSVKVV
jgi:predicted HNH restriction endonuclease